jgi:hypothetical protein
MDMAQIGRLRQRSSGRRDLFILPAFVKRACTLQPSAGTNLVFQGRLFH